MNKKLITIIAMLALVSSFVMAAQEVSSDLPAPHGTPVTAYTEDEGSVTNAGPDVSTVVADAATVPFKLVLEAQDSTGWVPAAGQKVYDSSWNVRADFTANFRVHVTEGSKESAQGLKVTIETTPLTRLKGNSASPTGYSSKGVRSIVNPAIGTSFSALVKTGNPIFTFNTNPNHMYGLNANNDSFSFGVQYLKDEAAPAGRYESTVTVTYEVV